MHFVKTHTDLYCTKRREQNRETVFFVHIHEEVTEREHFRFPQNIPTGKLILSRHVHYT
jgi:hypothetical protein